MKDIVKTALVLSIIALIAGLLLGGVNQFTYQSPEEKLNINLNKAYENAGGYESLNVSDYTGDASNPAKMKGIYKAKDSGEDTVYIYATSVKAYKSGLELMIVVKNNKIIKILVTASEETIAKPFGEANYAKYYNVDITSGSFKGFVTNKQPAADGKTEITVVTGATKSSNGICYSADLAVTYHKQLEGGAAV